VHHSAAQHFQPAARRPVVVAPADIDFSRRLGEREIRWAQPHFEFVLEIGVDEGGQHALEIGEGHPLIDQQAFDLVELRSMGLVGIAAEHPSGGDDPHRRRLILHHPDLDRRGVRPQQAAVRQVERVVHRPRRDDAPGKFSASKL
jgi:hypothetical protein